MHNFLVANDYQPSIVDPCIYLRRTVTGFVAIEVYVDDFAIFSSNEQLLRDTKNCLMNRFAMKDLRAGDLSLFRLGGGADCNDVYISRCSIYS